MHAQKVPKQAKREVVINQQNYQFQTILLRKILIY